MDRIVLGSHERQQIARRRNCFGDSPRSDPLLQERSVVKAARKAETEEAAQRKKDLATLKLALKTKCVALAVTREGEPALVETKGVF